MEILSHLKLQLSRFNKPVSEVEVGLLNKSSCFAEALSVTKLITVITMNVQQTGLRFVEQ